MQQIHINMFSATKEVYWVDVIHFIVWNWSYVSTKGKTPQACRSVVQAEHGSHVTKATCILPRLDQVLYVSRFCEALWTIYFCHFVVSARLIFWKAIHPIGRQHYSCLFPVWCWLNYKGQMIQNKDLIIKMQLPRHPYKRKELVMLAVFHLTWFIMPHLHSCFLQS